MSNPARPPVLRNRGGGCLERYKVAATETNRHYLYLLGHKAVVAQIKLIDQAYRVVANPPSPWTNCLMGRETEPAEATVQLMDLLRGVLSLPCRAGLDFALALDWYKSSADGSDQWVYTAVGDLVHRAKYLYDGRPDAVNDLRVVGEDLVDRLCVVIDRHPLLSMSDAIASVPSHDSKRVSFGARLPDAVARRRGQRLVRCAARGEFRTQMKNIADLEARALKLADRFYCTEDLTGARVVVIDDLYSSGATAAETARALRAAGAAHVACVCAVRTMRS